MTWPERRGLDFVLLDKRWLKVCRVRRDAPYGADSKFNVETGDLR